MKKLRSSGRVCRHGLAASRNLRSFARLVAAAAPAQSGDLYNPYEYTGDTRAITDITETATRAVARAVTSAGTGRTYGLVLVVERHWDYWERRYPTRTSPLPLSQWLRRWLPLLS